MSMEVVVFLVILVAVAIGIQVAVRRGRKELPPAKDVSPARPLPAPKPAAVKKPVQEEPEPQAPEPAASAEPTAQPTPAAPAPRVARDTAVLKAGLEKTRGGFVAKMGALLQGKKTIDLHTLERLEEVLITADIGVKTSARLFEAIKKDLSRAELTDPSAIWAQIRAHSAEILDVGAPPLDPSRHKPFVLLTIGVNGVGKTTTIGKLASKFTREGKKVLLGAGDTFRAAATEQLEIWGQRTGCPVIKGKEGSDPSSVLFEAIKKAQREDYDIVIADTAGRLHTKVDLMEELQKVRRVTDKAMAGAPHETLLVVDATTGQNAIAQATLFKEAMDITGIVLTKLDGTAKGGVILGICNELKIPVRYVGIGEKVEDLREFDPSEFVDALYEGAEESAAA
jgi:fused signal recognition particle receptor